MEENIDLNITKHSSVVVSEDHAVRGSRVGQSCIIILASHSFCISDSIYTQGPLSGVNSKRLNPDE